MWNLPQKRFSKGFECREFVSQRRIEHHIRIFLEWEDMTFFAAPHRFPAFNGLSSSIAALARVTHNTADESCVSGGNAVVAIQVQLCQSRNVNPKCFGA